jgi:tRNA 2-thiouridine synthesizing protein A
MGAELVSLQYVPDHIYDAGSTGFSDLIMNLSNNMKKLTRGQIIEVISNDPGVRESLPSWCKNKLHTLLDRKDFGKISYYYIEKR